MAAALEPERWLESLDLMASHTGSARGQLIGVGGARDIPFNLVTNFDALSLQAFIDIGGALPERNYRIAACNQALARGDYDRVVYEKDYDAVIPQLTSDRYVEFCADMDIPFGCQSNLVVDRVGLVGLSVLRTRRDGVTNAAQRRTFARATAAARRAVRLQERLEGDQARLLAGAFEAIAATAFILDPRGRVQAMTRGAEAIVATGRVALRSGYLEAEGTPMPLARGIAGLIADDGIEHLRLRIDSTPSHEALFMEGFRLPQRAWSLGRLPHAILLVKPPLRDRAGIAAYLAALYGLTPSEADVAMRLYDGASRDEIAAPAPGNWRDSARTGQGTPRQIRIAQRGRPDAGDGRDHGLSAQIPLVWSSRGFTQASGNFLPRLRFVTSHRPLPLTRMPRWKPPLPKLLPDLPPQPGGIG